MKQRSVNWVPIWLDRTRPRIVVEEADCWERVCLVGKLQTAGFQVEACAGPDIEACRTCPLVTDGWCTLLAEADAVVYGLPLQLEECRAVFDAIRGHDLPVFVEFADPEAEPVDGVTKVAYDPDHRGLLVALRKHFRR